MRDDSARRIREHSTAFSHARTAGSTLTAQQTDNNIVRVAIQAMAAVLGGTHHCLQCRDEGWVYPTEDAARLALPTSR